MQTDRQTNTIKHIQTDTHSHRQTETVTGTHRQIDTDCQTYQYRLTDIRIHTHTFTHTFTDRHMHTDDLNKTPPYVECKDYRFHIHTYCMHVRNEIKFLKCEQCPLKWILYRFLRQVKSSNWKIVVCEYVNLVLRFIKTINHY